MMEGLSGDPISEWYEYYHNGSDCLCTEEGSESIKEYFFYGICYCKYKAFWHKVLHLVLSAT